LPSSRRRQEFLDAIRGELPEDGILSTRSPSRVCGSVVFPGVQAANLSFAGYQDNLGWGFATALGAQYARPTCRFCQSRATAGFLFTSNELANRHRGTAFP
jgi:acetolactate synthase-1/2/3 large subunit